LFAEQAGRNRGAFSKDHLKRYAAEIALESQTFDACLDSGRYASVVRAETETGRQKGVTSTPTLMVNGQKLQGVPTFEQLRLYIEAVPRGVVPAG
jgi:protein-disulfide isomerase